MSWFRSRHNKHKSNDDDSRSTTYRKQLQRKRKPQLIALCRKKGLPQYGTKTDLIDRLVIHQESKQTIQQKTTYNEYKSITFSRKSQKNKPNTKDIVIPTAVLLVDGYIREQFIEPYNMLYPYDLTKIFCEYLDHIWVLPEKYNHCMTRSGTMIYRPPLNTKGQNVDMIIGYSRGWDVGVFEFQLKCIKPARDAIGIISEIDECEIEQWISAIKGNTYYYVPGSKPTKSFGYAGGGGGGIYSGSYTNNSPPEQFLENEMEWNKNDIIKLRVDCDNSSCMFFKNNKQIGETIDIQPNCIYHPVLATSEDGSHYELIMD